MHTISATGSRGFTLFELLVVIAIVVLIACAWPLASEHLFAKQRLRNETQMLVASIRMAEVTARATGITQTLVVLQGGGGYILQGEPAHNLPAGMSVQMRQSSPVPTASLALFADGSASAAAFELSMADRVVRLRVLPITGRVELFL